MIVAGLAAEGVTSIDGIHHIERGYESSNVGNSARLTVHLVVGHVYDLDVRPDGRQLFHNGLVAALYVMDAVDARHGWRYIIWN